MLEELKEKVLKANLDLIKYNLVIFTWGNVSEIDRNSGLIVIKPSGIPYDQLKVSDMVVVDLDGNVVEGDKNPSSDLPSHIELYKRFDGIKGICHTHSTFATAFAQAGKEIKVYGTTHADYFFGNVPVTRLLNKDEMGVYEKNTGKIMVELFENRDVVATPGCLVNGHGVFTWGNSSDKAVENAVALEEIAKMAYLTETLGHTKELEEHIVNKHYNRKHGKNAYYGQKKN